ncbi:MAG: hypothetical protein JWO67_3332 [Streptosporangiaceae bacterium]|nr:hypothetical protein [Streptosporangiaceae bacterium]
MTAHVEHQSNGDVLLSRRYPTAQPGCPTVRLRWTAEEFAEFVARVKAGEFDRAEDGAK